MFVCLNDMGPSFRKWSHCLLKRERMKCLCFVIYNRFRFMHSTVRWLVYMLFLSTFEQQALIQIWGIPGLFYFSI